MNRRTQAPRTWLWMGLVAAIAVAAPFAAARPPDVTGPRGARAQERFDDVMKQLQLTPEQDAQIKSLRSAHESETTSLRSQMKQLRKDLESQFQQETLDEPRILSLADQLAAGQAHMQRLRMEERIAIHKVLTPKQRQQLREIREEHRAKRGDLPD